MNALLAEPQRWPGRRPRAIPPPHHRIALTSPAAHSPVPAAAISSLWESLREHPLRQPLWQELAVAFGQAGLAPQAAYAAGQARRLRPGQAREAAPEPPGEHTPGRPAPGRPSSGDRPAAPGGRPTAAAAEVLLLHPEQPPARAWATALRGWLERCPGDWLSWLYLARLQDGVSLAAEESADRGAVPTAAPPPAQQATSTNAAAPSERSDSASQPSSDAVLQREIGRAHV